MRGVYNGYSEKRSVTESEIQQMKEHIKDNLDFSDQLLKIEIYNGTQLIGALNMYDFEKTNKA